MLFSIRTAKEVAILGAISIVTAFVVNYFSPRGIALVGEWDTAKGVVTARAKDDAVHHELEIDMADALAMHAGAKALFVDARSHDMYEEGHISGAVSFPVNQFDDLIDSFLDNHQVDATVIAYCSGRTCEDSHILAQYLIDLGFAHVRVYAGGYPEWEQAGHPVERQAHENN